MATQTQLRRGNTTANNSFVGAEGEVTVDTITHELHVHDGSTAGGYTVAKKSDVYSKNEINTALDTKADTATTLDGYGITDAYTKDEIDTSLSNYISTDSITNCVTKIPQDIKLELDNGTLTLKAGSKIYVPNGSGVFDAVVIPNDIVAPNYAGTYTEVVVYKSDGTLDSANINKCFSGTTSSTFTGQGIWYDTANNVCKLSTDSGSTWTNCSFPLCICNISSGTRDNIDQVFNGFGYIGSTVFALPGVKGLIPNGRNADGTLKNIAVSIDSIKTTTFDSSLSLPVVFGCDSSVIVANGVYSYNEKTNYNYDIADVWDKFVYATGTLTNGKITEFNLKDVFRIINYNEADYVVTSQLPTTENNYTWYRKYKSGWVEQGQQSILLSNSVVTSVTLPVAMASTNYSTIISCSQIDSSSVFGALSTLSAGPKSATEIYIGQYNNAASDMKCTWYVYGMAA